MAAEFVFGDMVCYRGESPHDDPSMYLGPCNHEWSMKGDIDMLTIPEGEIDCKDPAMWQRCTHLTADDSTALDFSRMAPLAPVEIRIDGKLVDPALVQFKEVKSLGGATHEVFEINGDIGSGVLTFSYRDTLP